MPLAAPRPCGHPGCRALVRHGERYCADHVRVSPEAVARREKAVDPFYLGTAWRRLRASYLRAHPLCARCGAVATLVHHVVERQRGGAEYDEANLQALCASCHARCPGHGHRGREER